MGGGGNHSRAPAWKDPKAEDKVAGAEGRFFFFFCGVSQKNEYSPGLACSMLLAKPQSMQPSRSGEGASSVQILPPCSSKHSHSRLRDRADPRPSLTSCLLLRSPPAGGFNPGAHSFLWSIRAEQKLPLPMAGEATVPSPRWLSGTRSLLPHPQWEPHGVTHDQLLFLLSPTQ